MNVLEILLLGVGVITAMEILQEFGGGSMQALVSLKYVSEL